MSISSKALTIALTSFSCDLWEPEGNLLKVKVLQYLIWSPNNGFISFRTTSTLSLKYALKLTDSNSVKVQVEAILKTAASSSKRSPTFSHPLCLKECK